MSKNSFGHLNQNQNFRDNQIMGSDSKFKPKRIHVFVNGNPTERIFFIHPKCRLSWSSILNFIGDLLKPQYGPIKVLRRTDGSAVRAYEELEDNGKYVACGKEALIQLKVGYRTDSEMEIRKDLMETSSSEIMNAMGGEINYLTDTNLVDILTIYVFINGLKIKPTKISLLKTDLGHWNTVLGIVSKQINNEVKHIYTIFGEKLKDPNEIHHRGFYVALPEGSKFADISYLSVFSAKKQRKVRFKHMIPQTSPMISESSSPPKKDEIVNSVTTAENTSEKNQAEPLVHNCDVINLNNPTQDSPCVHVTIVQRPFTASRHAPGIPSTVCATRPSAKLILEMLSDKDLKAMCHLSKSTQTNAAFCEAIPKGKCVIEVASRKFHIISDEDTIVLPCGTYFSSHRSMKKPCIFPVGNKSLSLENIANHIVGIVVDTSEYCVSRAIYGLDQTLSDLEPMKKEGENVTDAIPETKSLHCVFFEGAHLSPQGDENVLLH